MIIACTIDNNYTRHCAVMLRSLFEGNRGEDLRLLILHGDLDPGQRGLLVAYLGNFLSSVSLLHVRLDQLEGVQVHGHLTLATYFRLLFGALLPAGIKQLIFLDSDMIVADGLRDLCQTPLEGHPFAAVVDRGQEENLGCLGLGAEEAYFNAGVLLIDLEPWRQEGLVEKGLAMRSPILRRCFTAIRSSSMHSARAAYCRCIPVGTPCLISVVSRRDSRTWRRILLWMERPERDLRSFISPREAPPSPGTTAAGTPGPLATARSWRPPRGPTCRWRMPLCRRWWPGGIGCCFAANA